MLSFYSKRDFKYIICAFAVFVCLSPYFVWGASSIKLIFEAVALLAMISSFNLKGKRQISLLILVITYIALSLLSKSSVFGIISIILIIPLFMVDNEFIYNVYRYFVSIVAIVLLISLTIYIGVMVLGINLPNTIRLTDDTTKGFVIQYPFLVIMSDGASILPRFNGVFDEPGVIGNLSVCVLYGERFNFKKWYVPIFFIFGLFSLSITFVISVVIYVILYSQKKYAVVLIVLCFVLFPIAYNNDFLYEHIFQRLEFVDGAFSGDNRVSSDFDYAFGNFINSNDLLLGMGAGSSARFGFGVSSYKHLIYDYGLLIFLCFVLAFSTFSYKKYSLKFYTLCIINVFIILYQRPYITSYGYVFLMLIPLLVYNHERICLNYENNNSR